MEEDFQFEKTVEDGGIVITKYTGEAADLVIPAEINGVPVTAIGDRAFYKRGSMSSVFIPASVTRIGEDAFVDAGGLISVDSRNPNYTAVDGVLFDKPINPHSIPYG